MKKHMILTIIISIIVIGLVVVYIVVERQKASKIGSQEPEVYDIQIGSMDVPVIADDTQKNMEESNNQKATSAVFSTSMGTFTVVFHPESPKTVENFVKLAKSGFYNDVRFHRVIQDFMIQSGDPLSKDVGLKAQWGTGGPGYQFADEFNSHKLVQGSLAMANAGPNTNGSQFFIVTKDETPWLDGKHTNFGYVSEGMDVVMEISNTSVDGSDRPVEDVVIHSIKIQ